MNYFIYSFGISYNNYLRESSFPFWKTLNISLAIFLILADSSTFCTQATGIDSTPSKVPKIAPVIDPVESLSPEWLSW